MARLSELSPQYREAAVRLRLAIEDRQGLAARGDPDAVWEVALLRQMLAEMRDLRRLTESYYSRPRNGLYTTAGLIASRRDGEKQ
ncbi:hypothetical protein B5G34_14310 [Flavonifractor sp. An82]|uniref:hypothetical protein n=1 Tax=Flavonifractor sp. An82 TaxID=1965660 RepID=UPI000B3A5314|nr:hypothetical protein [Flavonifractor sp. An82]OUN20522.1 hypothetical protein B5G34_14310 [Flavonifractor sp. An82]